VLRRALAIALAGALALAGSGCRDDHVTIVFRPAPGASYTYAVHAESTTSSSLPGGSPHGDVVDLTAHQRVLDTSHGTTRVEVVLDRAGIGARTFVMRFDRAALLTAVDSVEGIPANALGDLGLSEIFPAAAGAPPDRALRPGDHWTIDDRVQLAGMSAPAHLSGDGRLIELGIVDGRDVATVVSTTSLPLTSTTTTADGEQTLRGTEHITITVVYDLADGTVRRSTSVTTGQFAVVLAPPTDQSGPPIDGMLRVEVRSTTERR
jgi:hypothetical protein